MQQSALLNEDDPLAQRTDGLLLCSVRDEGFAVCALRRACHEVENGLDSRTKYYSIHVYNSIKLVEYSVTSSHEK
jgi:hypothetical protein